MSNSETRLRGYALRQLERWGALSCGGALEALAEPPDATAWQPWRETTTTTSQWFWWRHPSRPAEEPRGDQADPDDDGLVGMKYGCGLIFYSECQPLRMAPDVQAALARYDLSSRQVAATTTDNAKAMNSVTGTKTSVAAVGDDGVEDCTQNQHLGIAADLGLHARAASASAFSTARSASTDTCDFQGAFYLALGEQV